MQSCNDLSDLTARHTIMNVPVWRPGPHESCPAVVWVPASRESVVLNRAIVVHSLYLDAYCA